ncbi:chorismate lyase [Uruburuella testudinis]|uniref:Chorismate lyase n=1 Tax=Uruburuella testudinis TaxID=1282863 RepID=A0ABY4DQS2_9NEIS|nr:chorismate lyase [Uruburuella testudinis]UOO81391.1 chorismate lyase [Uruburuella testudinis]
MNVLIPWRQALPPLLETEGAAALMQAPSLTVALRALGHGFSVRLLHLGAVGGDVWLADGLGDAPEWFARDVLLCVNDTPVVWARSLCAHSAEHWRTLLDCGTRPLGERLFDGSLPLSRSAFEYAVPDAATDLSGFGGTAFAARRSFFKLHGEALGLVECFLPALKNYLVDAN